MPKINVDPGQLNSGAGQQDATSSLLAQAAAQAGAAASTAAGAAGDGGAGGAIDGW